MEGRLFVAYSGGVDSHALLHLCALQADLHDKITAVYVHHGLQAIADAWGEHCRRQAQTLGVAFIQLDVDARPQVGESPEAAAREARYAALKSLLTQQDVVLLAQHREDQMETLLLQLFRGAGLAGLSAMPVRAPLGQGLMIRPLLEIGKQAILDYAEQQGLRWIEDPTNLSSDFDRNFLRNQVLPVLKQRWPSLDKTVTRSARHCADAQALLEDWAQRIVNELIDPTDRSLPLQGLKQYAPEQRNYLLRAWLKRAGFQTPSQAVLDTLLQIMVARDDANPVLSLQGRHLQRYRQRLYCLNEKQPVSIAGSELWPEDADQLLLASCGYLQRRVSQQGMAQRFWREARVTVRPRQGREKLKLPGRAGHHELKKLYQEAGVPPWGRQARPLIYVDERLAAVAGLWVDEWACGVQSEPCYQVDWVYVDPF